MTKPVPGDGQYFTLNPVPPPQPPSSKSWGLPIALGLLAIPLLMFGFGFSQQQQPAPTTAVSPTATPFVSPLPTPSLASQHDAITPQPETAATPPVEPSLIAAPSSDPATLPIAHIHSSGMAANFRAAPSLHSQVMGVLMHGDLVELSPERLVQQRRCGMCARAVAGSDWLAGEQFPWSFKPCPTLKRCRW